MEGMVFSWSMQDKVALWDWLSYRTQKMEVLKKLKGWEDFITITVFWDHKAHVKFNIIRTRYSSDNLNMKNFIVGMFTYLKKKIKKKALWKNKLYKTNYTYLKCAIWLHHVKPSPDSG